MKDIVLFFCFFLFLVSFLRESNAVSQEKNNGVYIVYMGAADGTKNRQAQLMTSLIRRLVYVNTLSMLIYVPFNYVSQFSFYCPLLRRTTI